MGMLGRDIQRKDGAIVWEEWEKKPEGELGAEFEG